jgi:mRNA-degrading endonuclease RelE of RelBE toxin-antitoxin system
MVILQLNKFTKSYKKLHDQQKKLVDEAISLIIKDPLIGQRKKWNLSDVYVYKFKIDHIKMLLAYKWFPEERILLFLGTHENFYRDLSKHIDNRE